jgi:serine/threonine protein kinase
MFFLALTPLNLALIGGGSLFASITGYVCIGCASGQSQQEQDVELIKDLQPLLRTKPNALSIVPFNFCKNNKCYQRNPIKVKWSKNMYMLERSTSSDGDLPSNKFLPSPKLSAFSLRTSTPLLYAVAKPDRCQLPLATSSSCRLELCKMLDAFNAHESFLPIEKCDFHLPSPHSPEESVYVNVVRGICKEGSLRDVLHCVKDPLRFDPAVKWDPKKARPLDEVDIREYAKQILLGLVELRSHGIISDRLSCDNVMIDHEGRAVISGIERTILAYPIEKDVRKYLLRTTVSTATDVALFGRVLYELATGDVLQSDRIDFVGAPEPSAMLLDLLRHIFPARLGPPRFRLRKEHRGDNDSSSSSSNDELLTPIRLLSHPFFTGNIREDDDDNDDDSKTEARLEYVPVLTFEESDTAQRILSMFKTYSNHVDLKRGPARRIRRRKSSVDTLASDASWGEMLSPDASTRTNNSTTNDIRQRLACRSGSRSMQKKKKRWSRVSRRRVGK